MTVTSAPLVKLGASFELFTVIVKVCDPDVLTPALAVPPSSDYETVTVAVPNASAAGVNVSVPFAAIAG